MTNDNQEVIYLAISTNYVEHWGFWEATREVLQNAIDTKDYEVSTMRSSGVLKIKSMSGAMDLSTLMLGESSKRNDEGSIGKYGEGYKLALLVLVRNSYEVLIKNGSDCWRVSIDKHPQMGIDCLAIKVFKGVYIDEEIENEVSFVITGLTYDDFDIVERNFIDKDMLDFNVIAENEGSYCFEYGDYEEDPKKVFVGGLYVCDLPDSDDYRYSYNFAPNVLELDRDRKTVDGFYLQYEGTKLLSGAGEFEVLASLANIGATDVSDYYKISERGGSYLSGSDRKATNEGSVKEFALQGFIKNHGENAFPISSNFNTEKTSALTDYCINSGKRPVVVKPALYDMLPKEIKEAGIYEIKEPVSVILERFLVENKKHIRSKPAKELSKIIKAIKIKG